MSLASYQLLHPAMYVFAYLGRCVPLFASAKVWHFGETAKYLCKNLAKNLHLLCETANFVDCYILYNKYGCAYGFGKDETETD